MSRMRRTPRGDAATSVILTIFRANGLLLAAGDALAGSHGLTAARWQVLGAIALAGRPLTVPQIARRMGLQRQSVHVSVNRLVEDGLLTKAPNSDHRRSELIELSPQGRSKYAAIDALQAEWVNTLTRGITIADLDDTARVLREICKRLETSADREE
jgi:DNA-binding MarR family transcriptional regulator